MASVVLADRNGVGNRLATSWGVGNTIAVSPAPPQLTDTPAKPTGSVEVHEVRWETSLFQPIYRKLVNESAATFLGLQKLSADSQGPLSTDQLVKISRQYRSILRDCQEQLDNLAETSPAAQASIYSAQSEVTYKLELIWNLVEILIIKPGGFIMSQLLHWISLHFTDCEDGAKSVLSQSSDTPEDHVEYWSSLQEFVLQGRMDQARNLLRLHSDYATDMFASMDELLRKMPQTSSATNMAEFDMQWRNWQVEVVGRLQAGDFAVYPELNQIAEILAGQEETLNSIADRCETWYQWMVYRLLYTNPAVRGYDLSIYAQQAIDRFGGLQSLTSLDSVLLGIIELELPEVIRELCLTLDNFWFPAHLLDLLHRTGAMSGETGISGAGLREFLLLDYATSLMSHNSLWQLGVVYFDHCPVQGKQRLEALLERVHLANDYKANKVLEIAQSRGLHSVLTSTCKVMGMKALASKDTGSAMAWALKSQDAKFTTFLADKLLFEYTNSGKFSSRDLLDNLGTSIIVSDRLTFLGKYREFNKMRDECDYIPAAELLHSLLWSRLAPKYFWVTLLVDALPFLTADAVLLTGQQTHQLLQCLQELTSDPSLPEKQQVILEEQETSIRLALAKNLARAMIKEGDSSTAAA